MKYDLIKTDNLEFLLVMDGKEIIAHLPLKENKTIEGVDLLPPLPEGEDVEELAKEWNNKGEFTSAYSFKEGYNKAKEKYQFTQDDMITAFKLGERGVKYQDHFVDVWEDFKKLLQQPKLPIAFESQDEYRVKSGTIQEHKEGKAGYEYYEPKTITTPEGNTQWVGKYIF
jgi:hypothetical protein